MRLKAYDKYKECEIYGIEKIPEHWEIRRIKDIFTLMRGKFTHRPRNNPRLYRDGTFPFIQTGDVSQANKYITTYKQKLNKDGIKVSKKFKKDTVVMTIAANIGDVAILGFDAYFPDSIVGFLTKENQHYFYYLLTATQSELDKVKITNTQDNLNLERLNVLLKICPPQEEQTAIANYLDGKTAQIDSKIRLLEQKIRSYRELKQALIDETVCRDLNKDAPLKESGVPWIGKIPVHWEVKRVKDVVYINQKTLGENIDPEYQFNYIDIGNVDRNGVIQEPSRISFKSAPSRARRIVKKNDVIISTVRTYLKAIAFFKDELKDVIVSTGFAVLSPMKTIVSSYLSYAVRSEYFVGSVSKNSVGESYPAINSSTLGNLAVAFPEYQEQRDIAEYLDKKTQRIDAIVMNLTRQIASLQELKSTLINDVVTGKLKVA